MERERSEDSQLKARHSIDIDSNRGYAYMLILKNNRIRNFTVDVKLIAKWASVGSEDGQFIKSEDIAVDLKTANVYTIDMGNSPVHVFGIAGHELSSELVRQ
jgi:hypothetical protein